MCRSKGANLKSELDLSRHAQHPAYRYGNHKIATTSLEMPQLKSYNSEPTNVLWGSEANWMSVRSGLLVLLIQLDGLVSFSTDQARTSLIKSHGKDACLAF